MLFVDIFTKYCKVIPLKTNTITDVLYGINEGIKAMHGKPETIYWDGEGAMNAILVKEYLAAENIRLIQTRSHAAVAERHMRTIKDMLFKRMEHLKTDINDWHEILDPVLLQYNTKMIHSSMDMTPEQARDSSNEAIVKGRLEVGRITKRRYPDVHEGDTVKVFQRKMQWIKKEFLHGG